MIGGHLLVTNDFANQIDNAQYQECGECCVAQCNGPLCDELTGTWILGWIIEQANAQNAANLKWSKISKFVMRKWKAHHPCAGLLMTSNCAQRIMHFNQQSDGNGHWWTKEKSIMESEPWHCTYFACACLCIPGRSTHIFRSFMEYDCFTRW